ncbi:MAG: hypothetical protein PHC34_05365 [Candidatus Gastranaerophilales bacterium]|nr:hypothetical protein [Candidatus Gastranaerophilales bacterium]
MAICKICKKEFISLKDSKEYCPACRISSTGHKEQLILDRHLEEKQKRSSSE